MGGIAIAVAIVAVVVIAGALTALYLVGGGLTAARDVKRSGTRRRGRPLHHRVEDEGHTEFFGVGHDGDDD